MKYEFLNSWSFNQMLLVSVFTHLLLMTIVMFMPKSKLPQPAEVVAWNVNLIDIPAGGIEETKPMDRPQKAMVQAAKKSSKQEEKSASITKPTPAKPTVPAKKIRTRKRDEIEKKAAVPKPPPAKPSIPAKKPSPPPKKAEIKDAAAAPKPVAPKPAIPNPAVVEPENLLKLPFLPEIMVREKLLEVPKVALSTPKISHSKPQPKSLPKPRKRPIRSESGVAKELDQIAKLYPAAREKISAVPNERLITEESFNILDGLMQNKGKVTRANIVPQSTDDPLEGFYMVAMRDEISDTRPHLVSGKDATLIQDLEFAALAKKNRTVAKLPGTKFASNMLQGHTQRQRLDAITKTKPPSPEAEIKPRQTDKAYKSIAKRIAALESSSVDVSVEIKPSAADPKYKTLSVEKLSAVDLLRDHVAVNGSQRAAIKKSFKSGIRDTVTDIPKKETAEAKSFIPKRKALAEEAVILKKSPIGKAAILPGKAKVASLLPPWSKGVAKSTGAEQGSLPPKAPSKDDKRSAEVLSLYAGFIREKVMSNWKNPLGAEHNQVLVSFYLYPSGKVDKPYVEKSSGNPQLDHLALRAISDSEPFPKFPSELKQSNLHISIHFKYVYLQD